MKVPFASRFARLNSLAAAISALLAAHSANAGSLAWDGSGVGTAGAQGGVGNWDTTTANWWNGAADVVWPSTGTDNDGVFGGAAGTVTVVGVTANDIAFNTTGYTISGGTLTLNGTTPTLTTGSGVSATISSVIAGSAGLAKAGAGMLTLSGVNTYTGATSVATGGTLSISQDANLSSAPASALLGLGNLVLDDTGTLATTSSFTLNPNRGINVGRTSGIGAGTFDVATGTILTFGGVIASNGASSTGGLTKAGTGTLVLSGANSYTGTTTVTAGTLKLGSASAIPTGPGKGDVVVNATLDLNGQSAGANGSVNGLSGTGTITSGAAGAITFSVGGNNGGGTFNGVIQNGSGTLAFAKIGSGTLTLGGSNTFTGGVTINNGILQLASAGALNSTTPNSITFGANAPNPTKLQLNIGSVTIGSLATDPTPGSVVIENVFTSAATLTVSQTADKTFAGVVQDGSGGKALALTKSGGSVLTLSGTNTYTGTTTITAGTLALSGGRAILDTGAVSLNNTSGAILLLNASETIGSLAGGGGSGGNVSLQAFTLTTGGTGTDTAYSGVISGSGSLIKTGSGVLTLGRGNTYTGTTAIKNGSSILGVLNALPAATTLSLGDGSTNTSGLLKMNGLVQTLAGLTTAGTGTANRVVNGNATAVNLTLNIASSSSFGGILGGSTSDENNFSLVKTGVGTMTLSGTNSFAGSTTISQGTISVGNLANALGTSTAAVILGDASNPGTLSYTGITAAFTRGLAVSAGGGEIDTTTAGQTLTLSGAGGDVAITTTGAFTVGGAGNTTINSNITGSSGAILNKTGVGTLTLAGSNTYSGATNIKNGTLVLGVSNSMNSAATVTLGDSSNNNGVLKLAGFSQTLSSIVTTGGGTGNRVTGGSSLLSTLTINNTSPSTFGGILGGSGSNDNNLTLTKSGTATLTLSGISTYTGGTTIAGGTLAISLASNLGASSGTLSIGAGTLQVTASLASPRAIVLTDTTAAIAVNSGLTYTDSGNLSGSGALNLTSTGTLLVSAAANSYTGGTNIQNGILMLGRANALPTDTLVTLGSGANNGKLALNGFSQTLAGLAIAGTGSTNRVVNGRSLAATLTLNPATDMSFGGILGGTAANENVFGLTKSGAGTLTLSGINTYTGATTIASGTLSLANSAGTAIADTSAVVLANDATAVLRLNFNETVGSLAGGGTTGGTVSLQTNTLTAGGDNSSTTFGGVISGSGGFTKTGTGTLTLSGTNTYSGLTSVTGGGVLALSGGSAIADSSAVSLATATGTTLLLNASETIGSLAGGNNSGGNVNLQGFTLSTGANGSSTSFGGLISGTGGLEKVGSGIFTLSHGLSYSGDTTISAGSLVLGGDNILPVGTGKGNVIVNGTLDINGRTGVNASINGLSGSGTVTNSSVTAGVFTVGNFDAISTFSGTLVDGASSLVLTKVGVGTLTLAGTNTYTGLTTISAGTLALSNGSAIADSGAVTLGNISGARLLLNANETIGSLYGGGTTGGDVNLQSFTLSVGANNSSPAAYAGIISGSGGLTKIGSGTLTLSGTLNSYTGSTWIQNGKISTNNLSDGSSNLGSATSAIILGDTSTTGALYYSASGGTLSRSLDVRAGGGEVEVSTSTKTLVISGTVSLGGNLLVEGLGNTTLSGVLSGAGSLTKLGVGVLALSNTANTYAGGTTVSGGLINVTVASGTPLGTNSNTNNIVVTAGGNLSLSDPSNKGGYQTITVASSATALGGIGFSSTTLTQTQLTGLFTDNTGSYGGVLSINNGISYGSATTPLNPIDLSSFGSGAGQGYWYLGSGSTGSFTGDSTKLTVGAGNTYRLGGGGGTLTLTKANTLINSNDVMVGSGLTNGNGSVVINLAQSYTGKTTVTGGAILSIGLDTSLGPAPGSATPSKLVLDGGTLQFRVATTLDTNRGIAVGPTSGTGAGTIDTNGYAVSYAGIIANNGAGTGSFTKTAAGILTLTGSNTYSGTTNLTGGSLNFANLGNLGTGTTIAFNGGTLQFATGNTLDVTAYRSVTTTASGGAAIDTNGNDVSFASSAIAGTGGFSKAGLGTLTLSVANSYSGNTTIGAGTLKLGNAAAIPSGVGYGTTTVTSTLDLNNFSASVNLLTGAGTITNSQSGTATLTADNGGSNSSSTFSGIVTNGGGTVSLNKTGTNTLILSGTTSSYSGGTTVSAGTLSITNDRALGAVPGSATPGNITLASGSTLTSTADLTLAANRGIAINGNTAASFSVATSTTLIYNGIITNANGTSGGLTKSIPTGFAGTLVLGGTNTYAGDTTLSGGTLQVTNPLAIPSGAGKGNLSVSGTLDLVGNAITVNGLTGSGTVTTSVAGAAGITAGGNNATSAFSGAIQNGSGGVSVGKIGSGTLTLSGANTYTGTTTISQGTLSVSDIAAGRNLGSATSAIVLGDATNTGILSYSGNGQTFTRGFSVSAGGGEIDTSTSGSLLTISTGDVATAGAFTVGGAGSTSIASNITDSGTLSKTGVGTLTLTGTNSYVGNTTVTGSGTLKLGNAAAIPSGNGKGNLSLGTGSTLDLNNFSQTVNGLTGAGSVTNGLTGAATFTVDSNNTSCLFTGVIQDGNGTVSFSKTGTGTLTLAAANTYSGTTTVAAGGTLEIANAAALPSGIGKGNVIVNGTLDLDNSLTVNGLSGSGSIATDTALAIVLTAGANDQISSFAGSLANGSGGGSLALTKTGLGTLTLAGNNTYSGATTISNGTLAMGSGTGLSPNSTVTVAGPGFLDVNGFNVTMDGLLGSGTILNNGASAATLTAGAGGGSSAFGGVIADGSKALALTKSGAGTLTLTGVNTYSGTTTIGNGTISVANPGAGGNLGTAASAIVLGAAATKGTLSYTGAADLTLARGFDVQAGGGEMDITTSAKTLTLQTGAITTAGTFSMGGAGNVIVSSVISGNGGFAKANTGTMLVNSANTYAGDTTLSSGTLQLGNAAAIPSGSGKGNVTLNGVLDVNNLSITLNGLAGTGTITNTAGAPVILSVGDNSAAGNFTGVLQDGSGTLSLTKLGGGLLQLGGANTYSGNTCIAAGTLQINNAAAIPSGANKGNVALAGTLDLHATNITVNGLSGVGTVTNNGSAAAVIAVGAFDQTSTFGGNIGDAAGTTGLTKTGTGTLTLSGNNTFSGATTISQGTLSMGSNTGLSASSTLTIANPGALDLNGRFIAIDGLAGTGSITNNSATPVSLTTGASGGSGIFGGTINDGAGVIALAKTGAGSVTLSNVNSYSGGTTVTGGQLVITANAALGAIPATATPANIVLNGGAISASNTLEIAATRGIAVGPASGSGTGTLDAAINQTLTYNGIIANNGAGTGYLAKTGPGTVTLGGVNTYTGDTTIAAGALQIGNALAIPSGSGHGNAVVNATLDLNNTSITVNGLSGTGLVSNTKPGNATLSAGANNQTSTFAGVIENGNGTTLLTKLGSGVLTLTGINTYRGPTTVAAGTLQISQDSNLGNAPGVATPGNLVLNGAATLAATQTFALATTRGIAVGPSGAGIIDVAPTQTLTYGGAITDNGGSGGFTKTGTGILVLGGSSSYTGTTTVTAGTLTINGSIASSANSVVRSGATLTGTGTTGAMTIDPSGTLAPGNSGIGTLSVANGLTLAGNAAFELGTPGANHAAPGISDRVDVTGDIHLGGNLDLSNNANANGQGSVGAGSYKIFTYTGTTVGQFDSVSGLPTYHWALHDMPADKAIYIDMYNYAVAGVTPAVDLGRIHAGGNFGTQALAVTNGVASGSFSETLGGSFATPSSGITATGAVTGIAGQTTDTHNMLVGISDNTAGAKLGSVAVNFISQAVGGSGLSNTPLAPQSVTVTGFAYTGQAVWNQAGSGTWGNNGNAYDNWTRAGGVAGLDGILSAGDTATFGNTTSGTATVSLNGANPTLSGVTFDNASHAYTLAQGSGLGTLTLKGNGGAADLTVLNGSHTVSAPLSLESDTHVTISNASDALAIAGTISGGGYGITKSGAGTLIFTGNNLYTGTTTVNGGTLLVNNSSGSGTGTGSVSIASGATLGGTGTIGGDTVISGTLAPGNGAGTGTLAITGTTTFNSNSIFDWDLNASATQDPGANATNAGDFDKLAAGAAVSGTDAMFRVVLGTNAFGDSFWNTNKTWNAIITGLGKPGQLSSLFPKFGGAGVALDGSVSGRGSFSFSGNNLNWNVGELTAIPEPATLTGLSCLVVSGMLLRSRRRDASRPTI